jgi:hypothetical protein
VKIIFDTDMSGDTDDVVALSILNAYADQGKAEILACLANGQDADKAIAASISAINTYYGRPNIPIGTDHSTNCGVTKSHYTATLRDKFANSAKPDDQRPLAVDVYRKALAAAPDHSVKIVSVGFLTNLHALLDSKPDAISPLTGTDLVKQKVTQLVCMGGGYPNIGGEFNFAGGLGGADAKYAVDHWPTPILFSGFEIGQGIATGQTLRQTPDTNPAKTACDNNGHASFDPTAVVAAVEDPKLYWTISAPGYCEVVGGGDQWHTSPDHGHTYLIKKVPEQDVAKRINDLLALPPKVH